ncbi:hypothetical protein [Pedobacter africanus]|uniref:Carboxypeptidase regulatory-like domain-containing protein n=1 Tax=Pedobacter africanus TaxID=151894 RepID=A0A1W2CWG4_9SPHI|nr:hypothetical protein [Pedobacter africanus]SMC89583.1 hypothetical protein SAMN04488524_3341 [Pedobacter africanus]
MKTKITITALLLISVNISFAQENRLWLLLGAGAVNTSKTGKDNLMGNGYNIEAEAFVPFYNKKGFSLGGVLNGSYTSIRNLSPDNATVASKYQVYGGSVAVNNETAGKASGSFSGLLGAQAILKAGNFSILPAVSAGYLRFDQQGYTQTGSAMMNNGQSGEMVLVKTEKQKNEGLVLKPQLKLGYALTTNFTLFIASAYTAGPALQHTSEHLVPQGGFNDKNTYETSQLSKGTWESQTTESRYRSVNFNAGIMLGLGKRKATKGPGAASSSYAAGRLSMTPTSARQTPNTSFGKKASAITADGPTNPLYDDKGLEGTNPLARPGNPIGGIIVKGGKNPGGNAISLITDQNGKINFTVTEVGTYTLRITSPDTAGSDENSTKSQRKGRTYTAGRKNETPNAGIMAGLGNPIGGIIVKGGKNPGGGAFNLISNDNGEVTFTVNEPGAYQLQITAPETSGKSISSKGVSSVKPAKSKH